MSGEAQRALDTRAIEIAAEARTIAEATRDRVHDEFGEFRRENTAQHQAGVERIEALREHISESVGKVHDRIDRLVRTGYGAVIVFLFAVVGWLLTNAPPWRAMIQ